MEPFRWRRAPQARYMRGWIAEDPNVPSQPDASSARLLYLDNLRTALTVLVVCHHSAIAFGAAGGWYYVIPPPPGSVAPLVLTFFAAINQAFFMSLFFAIAGYFTPASYDAKGPASFLSDRLARLGIPLLVYFFVLNPILVYLVDRFRGGASGGLIAFLMSDYLGRCGTGPLWFALALLLFGVAFAAARLLTGRARERRGTRPLPGNRQVLVFVLGMGLVAFVLRFAFPVGWQILGLQLGYFPLYVAFFVLGVQAHGNGWPSALGRAQATLWFRAALVAIACLPAIVLIGSGRGVGADGFRGGANPQAFVYAMWEPVVCVGICMKLVVMFRERFAAQRALAQRMARSAYAAYVIHPFFVVCGTALLLSVPVDPLLRFLLLCPLAVIPSFALADGIRRAPGLRRIL